MLRKQAIEGYDISLLITNKHLDSFIKVFKLYLLAGWTASVKKKKGIFLQVKAVNVHGTQAEATKLFIYLR